MDIAEGTFVNKERDLKENWDKILEETVDAFVSKRPFSEPQRTSVTHSDEVIVMSPTSLKINTDILRNVQNARFCLPNLIAKHILPSKSLRQTSFLIR